MKKYQKYFLPAAIILLLTIFNSCNSDDSVSILTKIQTSYKDGQPFWSPNGSKMIYYSGDNESGVYALDMDGLNAKNKRYIGNIKILTLADNGSSLIYHSYNHGYYKRKIEGDTNSVQISPPSVTQFPITSLSKDGQWFVYADYDKGEHSVWKVKVDGTKKKKFFSTRIDGEIRDLQWFPDGIRLSAIRYFSADNNPNGQIAIIDTNGNSLAALTNTFEYKRDPELSPDGNYVAYAVDRYPRTAIFIVKTDGSEIRELTFGYIIDPKWNANSTHVTYTSGIDGRIWAAPISGGSHIKITE